MEINAYVDSLLGYCVESILKVTRPRAIVLYGSLGRGEGTACGAPNGPALLSDIELGVVSRNLVAALPLRHLCKKLQEESLDVTLSFFLPRRFSTRVASNWALPSQFLTLEQYELLSGLRVLYGRDPRSENFVPVVTQIMPWDALRLVFNRVAEFLACLLETPVAGYRLAKSINKLLVACGDATLLLAGDYHHLLLERRYRLQALLQDPRVEGLPDRVDWGSVLAAYDWRLRPTNDTQTIALPSLINHAVFPVMRLCTRRILGWSFDDAGEFAARYLSSPNLKDCSRSFPGHPWLQSLLLSTKRCLHTRRWTMDVSLWKAVHEAYADLVCLLTSMCEGRSVLWLPAARIEPTLAGESRARGLGLVRRWEDLCCIL